MVGRDPTAGPGPEAAVYVISVAAELTGLHPQTLRSYERMGLITPGRTGGGGRRYSGRDVELLRQIAELTASGVGVEGVRRILELEHQVDALRMRNDELQTELARTRAALRRSATARRTAQGQTASRLPVLRPSPDGRAVVVWRPDPD